MTNKRPGISAPAEQTDGIPEGWAMMSLSEVTTHVPNVKPEEHPDRDFGYVDISSIDNVTFRIGECKRFKGSDAPSRARRPIQPGDVLFSNVRTYLRNIALVPPNLDAQLCSTGFTVLRTNGAVEPSFLFHYVLTEQFIQAVTPQQTGTHYPATSDRIVMGEPIPLPPLAEQRRIVAKVEALLARVNAARERLAKVPTLLKRFRQSVLAAACSGQLTADWREEHPCKTDGVTLLRRLRADRAKRLPKRQPATAPLEVPFSLPDSWAWGQWYDLVDWVTYGFTRPMPHVPQGIPIVTAKNISASRIDVGTVDNTTPGAFAELSEKDRPRRGEILLTKDGSIGRAAIVDTDQPFCINQSVAVLRFGGPTAHVPYLLRVIEAPFTQSLIDDGAKGSAIRHISITAFATFPCPVPPLTEQKEIVRRVEALFTLADKIEAGVQAATARVEKMTQAILAKAFRGELVPTEAELARQEAREYEPASVLLERIRAARASAGTTGSRQTPRRGRR